MKKNILPQSIKSLISTRMLKPAAVLFFVVGLITLTFFYSFMGTEQKPAVSTKSYLALGDSYTIGEGVNESDSWPFQLVRRMNKDGYSVKEPVIIARTGWRTDNLESGIEVKALNTKYDLVSLLIGVNNQFQGKDITTYKKDLRGLINTAITFCSAGSKGVFVLSIPDYGATPFGKIDSESIGKEIDEWNAACKAVCAEFEIPFFDITPISRRGIAEPDLVAKDGLHPSGKMYSLWVDLIAADVEKMIAE